MTADIADIDTVAIRSSHERIYNRIVQNQDAFIEACAFSKERIMVESDHEHLTNCDSLVRHFLGIPTIRMKEIAGFFPKTTHKTTTRIPYHDYIAELEAEKVVKVVNHSNQNRRPQVYGLVLDDDVLDKRIEDARARLSEKDESGVSGGDGDAVREDQVATTSL